MTNNGNGYCQYLIDKEDRRGSTDEEMLKHTLSLPLPRGLPRSHSVDMRNNVLRQLPTVRFEPSG